jgi:hypothetical protein
MKVILAFCSFLLLPTFHASAADTPASNISISTPTEIPGMSLDPGSYSIRVVGKLSDRVILKVTDRTGKTSVDFLASLTGQSKVLRALPPGVSRSQAPPTCADGCRPAPRPSLNSSTPKTKLSPSPRSTSPRFQPLIPRPKESASILRSPGTT